MPGKKKKSKKGGGKKGGKKGKKSSISLADIYRPPPLSPEDSLYECLLRTRWWLIDESANIQTYISKWKQSPHKGDVPVDEFKSALRYLEIPASLKQIDLLIKYLDAGFTGSVQLKLLTDLVTKKDHELLNIAYTTSLIDPPPPPSLDQEEETESGGKKKGKKKKKGGDAASKTEVIVKKDWRKGEPCKTCGIPLLEPPPDHKPQFVQLQLTLAMFRDLSSHPAHFITNLTTSTTVHGLVDIIINHWHKSTSVVAIFTEPSCKKEFYLNPSWSLLECGLKGGLHEYAPTRYQLFYDFIPPIIDCPILMADNAMTDVPPFTAKRKL